MQTINLPLVMDHLPDWTATVREAYPVNTLEVSFTLHAPDPTLTRGAPCTLWEGPTPMGYFQITDVRVWQTWEWNYTLGLDYTRMGQPVQVQVYHYSIKAQEPPFGRLLGNQAIKES